MEGPNLMGMSSRRLASSRRLNPAGDGFQLIVAVVTFVLLAYIPYAEALNSFFPLRIAGYSALVTLTPAAVALGAVSLLAFRKPGTIFILLISTMIAVTVVFARVVFGVSDASSITLRDLIGVRYFALLPCYLALANAAVGEKWFRLWAPRIVVFNGIVNALVGIAYVLGILSFKLSGADTNVQTVVAANSMTRAGGLFSGTNMFANFLALTILMCVVTRWSAAVKAIACAILFGGIISAQSRFALAGASMVVIWYVFWERVSPLGKLARIAVLGAGVFAAPYLVSSISGSFVDRFDSSLVSDDIDVRTYKTLLGLRATFSGLDTMLVGARTRDIVLNETDQISDNSYVAILTSVGVPVMTVFLFILVVAFRHLKQRDCLSRAIGPFWFMVLSAASLNNAIYWDSWLFYMAVIYALLGRGWTASDRSVRRSPLPERFRDRSIGPWDPALNVR